MFSEPWSRSRLRKKTGAGAAPKKHRDRSRKKNAEPVTASRNNKTHKEIVHLFVFLNRKFYGFKKIGHTSL